MNDLKKLLESDLERASVVLAAKSLATDVQTMAEKIAKMRVDDLLPLVSEIKNVLGQEAGLNYQEVIDGILAEMQDGLTQSKDELERQAAILNGDEIERPETDMGFSDDSSDDSDDDSDDFEDDFAASDANVSAGNPMGREKRESVEKDLRNRLKLLQEKVNAIQKKRK